MTCDVENTSASAIAGLSYDLLLMEGDRSVPWGAALGELQVPGGIEHGETRRLVFETQGLPAEGWSEELRPQGVLAVLPWRMSDDAGSPAVGPPMTGAERDAFRQTVQSCWVVDPGSQEAGVTVTVVFELDRRGRVVSGPDLLTSSGGTPGDVASAFYSARRAVMRCAEDGYDLPEDKFGQWQVVEMTFDTVGMRVR